jgi:hypothetical protein
VLVGLDVGLDVLRRHQPGVVAEPGQLARPVMPRRRPRGRSGRVADWRRTPAPWRAPAAFSAPPGPAHPCRAPGTRSWRYPARSW